MSLMILIIIAAMALVGALMGVLAGVIWKGERPYGTNVDFIAAILTAIVVGLLDWYIIPAMGFSTSIRLLGIATEPALSALLVLWILRKAKK